MAAKVAAEDSETVAATVVAAAEAASTVDTSRNGHGSRGCCDSGRISGGSESGYVKGYNIVSEGSQSPLPFTSVWV